MLATKVCTKCGTETDQFHRNKKAADGLQSWCADCSRVHKRVVRYGFTPEQVREMERGNCDACGNAFTSTRDCHFDHDHDTGEFRSTLCGSCNTAFGLLNEDTDRIAALLTYALRWE